MGLKITFENGRVEQTNRCQYPLLRFDNTPAIDVQPNAQFVPALR